MSMDAEIVLKPNESHFIYIITMLILIHNSKLLDTWNHVESQKNKTKQKHKDKNWNSIWNLKF